MGFMDKAKAAANDLAAKADTAMSSSGMGGPGASNSREADRYLRDLGVLAYLEANGRPAAPQDRERVMDALRGMETQGTIGTLTLQTSVPPPPGGTVPPPPGGAVPPPPGGTVPPPVQQAQAPPPSQPAPTAPPPPPPSWMSKDDDRTS